MSEVSNRDSWLARFIKDKPSLSSEEISNTVFNKLNKLIDDKLDELDNSGTIDPVEHKSPVWVEVITEHSIKATPKTIVTTVKSSLINIKEKEPALVFKDVDNGMYGDVLTLNGFDITDSSYSNNQFMYERLKTLLVGKGNNYIQLKDGELRSLTIPTSNKKKVKENDSNVQTE